MLFLNGNLEVLHPPKYLWLSCFSPHITIHVINPQSSSMPLVIPLIIREPSPYSPHKKYSFHPNAQSYSFVLMLHLQARWNILECQLKSKISFPWTASSTCLQRMNTALSEYKVTVLKNVIPPFPFMPACEQTCFCKTQRRRMLKYSGFQHKAAYTT